MKAIGILMIVLALAGCRTTQERAEQDMRLAADRIERACANKVGWKDQCRETMAKVEAARMASEARERPQVIVRHVPAYQAPAPRPVGPVSCQPDRYGVVICREGL